MGEDRSASVLKRWHVSSVTASIGCDIPTSSLVNGDLKIGTIAFVPGMLINFPALPALTGIVTPFKRALEKGGGE